jgi:hypothetical protein
MVTVQACWSENNRFEGSVWPYECFLQTGGNSVIVSHDHLPFSRRRSHTYRTIRNLQIVIGYATCLYSLSLAFSRAIGHLLCNTVKRGPLASFLLIERLPRTKAEKKEKGCKRRLVLVDWADFFICSCDSRVDWAMVCMHKISDAFCPISKFEA